SRLQLLLACPAQPLAQDRQDLRSRPAVHEDDEPEAEPPLVLAVQSRELVEQGRILLAALLGRRAGPRAPRTGRGVRVEHLLPLVVGQRTRHLPRLPERVLAAGEELDEPCPPLEQLGELVGAQLPR